MAHPGGRPLKFQTVEELQSRIDDYFAVTPKDEWTWTGVALHLDTSRELLREYKEREEFVDCIKKALLKVENSYELDLKKKGQAGSIFALKNFGWRDKSEQEHTGKDGKDLFPQPLLTNVRSNNGAKESPETQKED